MATPPEPSPQYTAQEIQQLMQSQGAQGQSGPSNTLSNSPWAKMFPGGATEKQLQIFINLYVRNMITQFKQEQQEMKKASDDLKQVEEGNDPS